MSANLIRTLARIPTPVFGTAAAAALYTRQYVRQLVPFYPWAFPVVVGGLWFVWPAVDTEWKISMGFMKDPAAATSSAPAPKVELDSSAKKAIAEAYKGEEIKEETPEMKAVSAQIAKGDFSTLEKEWETFNEKAIKPGEDDDDDDDEEDDEDEDDDEEGGEEGGEEEGEDEEDE